jgi:hypothetical protein
MRIGWNRATGDKPLVTLMKLGDAGSLQPWPDPENSSFGCSGEQGADSKPADTHCDRATRGAISP